MPSTASASGRSFIDYKDVKEVVQVDRGEPVQFWAQVAHSHIQAFALMFLCLGGALLGLSFAVMILTPLYEMWVKRETGA